MKSYNHHYEFWSTRASLRRRIGGAERAREFLETRPEA
jgi:hypothetical protein